ncbi:putative N6-adenine-specific DNA methylase [Formivibrio citricus]|uniref:Putative N6-adenine-specific DNA methylase n=1 Tax=Formivibrio citricus TaxID=83765 RepID=A0A1I5C174_9NEIS|nr:THUMP domain-containing protein [Formivibrio citricus]SFN80646.1 putative N6-adenine-specific DNA methylase [Formivibrio citricus]
MKQLFHFFAPCPRGLENVLAQELTELKAENVQPTDGGVGFSGGMRTMMRANLHSRIASRILWKLAEKPYRSEEDIYRLARDIEWPDLFAVENTIKVNVTAVKSPLRSPEFAGLKTKDGICDRFRLKTGSRPSVDTREPDMRIHLFLTDRMAAMYLDTSGEALFKRGYRLDAGEAPLRENLAAGILALTGWQPGQSLYDPMCGSGTFLIEAALKARGIAPGMRRSFAFQQFRMHNAAEWDKLRTDARAQENKECFAIHGSDVSSTVLKHAEANLEAAGVIDTVLLKQLNVLDAKPVAESGIWLCNPPYGVRLDEKEKLAAFYPQWGDVLKQRFAGWRAYFFTGDLDLAKKIGLKASKRTVLFNGALECRLFEYVMQAGSMREREKPVTDNSKA